MLCAPARGGRTAKHFRGNDMKTQMRFQKILTLVSLIISALCIVYALLFCTPISAMSKLTYISPAYTYTGSPINADDLYDLCQTVNVVLLAMGIVFLLWVAFMYITASNKRRNYYVTNYVAVIGTAAFAAITAIMIIALTAACHAGFVNDVDWEAYRQIIDTQVVQILEYRDDTTMWTIGYIIAAIVIADALALVYNLLWKIKLMKGEKALLAGNTVREAA